MSAPQPLSPGDLFAGDYRIERELARGGMGTLYIVHQVSTGATRVLKRMHARLSNDARSRERFVQESRVGATLESDHVVQVFATGLDPQGIPWMVMEHLRGEDLATALVRHGRFNPTDTLGLMKQLCHALGAAHSVGLVHRDIKPENIFLTPSLHEGVSFTVKLLDFGLAKVLEDAATAQQEPGDNRHLTAAVGTPLWMSPEQAERATVSPASDVWSLGLLTFAILTAHSYWKVGNLPTAALDGLLRELFVDPIEPASLRAGTYGLGLPQGFDAWFSRCVSREPSSRFTSATEALALLTSILQSAQGSFSAPSYFAPNNTPDELSHSRRSAPSGSPELLVSSPAPLAQPLAAARVSPAPSAAEPLSPFGYESAPRQPPTAQRWDNFTPAPSSRPSSPPLQQPVSTVPPTVIAQAPALVQDPRLSWHPPEQNGNTQWTPSFAPQPPAFTSVPPTQPRRGRSTLAWLFMGLVAGLCVVGVGTGTYLYFRPKPSREQPSRRNTSARRDTPPPATVSRPRYVPPTVPESVNLSSGWAHACVLARNHTALCWGFNHFGQLGDGSTTDRASPSPVVGLAGAVELSAGVTHTCARLSNGTVACWGLNAHGELGDGSNTTRFVPVLAQPLGGVTQIASGDSFTCARLSNGTVACWGANEVGQLGDGTDIDRKVPTLVPGLTNVAEIAVGDAHGCARVTSGVVYCWGASSSGQVGDGFLTNHYRPAAVVSLHDAAAIYLGPQRSCALTREGTARCWGRNDVGQLGDGTRIARSTPLTLTSLGTVRTLSLALRHSCAIDTEHSLHCWGDNSDGQLGDGTTTARTTPPPSAVLSSVQSVSLGAGFSCSRQLDLSVRCWGSNDRGQLGVGGGADRGLPSPVTVP